MNDPLNPRVAGNLPAARAFPTGAQQGNNGVPLLSPASNSVPAWPEWAHTARIAGAYFAPTETAAALAARLDRLAAEHVSVVIADSPLGEQFQAWVDDAHFAAVRMLVATVVNLAHARNLKIVLYHTALEFISPPDRNPGLEHGTWAQRGLDGRPILYNDVSNDDEHWLHTGIWDFWVHPCVSGDMRSFSTLAFNRIRELVRTGIDGLWIDQAYLQSSVGTHHELWPSSDPCSAAAFQAAAGLPMPRRVDWDDPVFRRWVVWRHTQIADYLLAVVRVASAVNPNIVVLNENSCVDTCRSTYVAADPAAFVGVPGIATGHEIETVADRMDHGETGMQAATLAQWLAFRTMVAFARAVDRDKPSWILTYGCTPRDGAQLAGFTLAEGANFYENKGPQMAATVGSAFRRKLFGWIAEHEVSLYASESAAEVGLLYSPRNRDLLDTVSGQPYAAEDSLHFAAYRGAAQELYLAHIPFDVVLDTDTARFDRYRVLIVARLELMSDATAKALRDFAGKLITLGANGIYDEWLVPRSRSALQGCTPVHFAAPAADLARAADTGLFASTAPAALQIGLRRAAGGWVLVCVNTARTPAQAFTVTLHTSAPLAATAHLHAWGAPPLALPVVPNAQRASVQVTVPSGIDSLALVTVCCEPPSGN
ncbi:MAG: hypothetical protein U0X20_05295 [Caldilineaceae bacterium]